MRHMKTYRKPKKKYYRPMLEVLEDRLAPATFVGTNVLTGFDANKDGQDDVGKVVVNTNFVEPDGDYFLQAISIQTTFGGNQSVPGNFNPIIPTGEFPIEGGTFGDGKPRHVFGVPGRLVLPGEEGTVRSTFVLTGTFASDTQLTLKLDGTLRSTVTGLPENDFVIATFSETMELVAEDDIDLVFGTDADNLIGAEIQEAEPSELQTITVEVKPGDTASITGEILNNSGIDLAGEIITQATLPPGWTGSPDSELGFFRFGTDSVFRDGPLDNRGFGTRFLSPTDEAEPGSQAEILLQVRLGQLKDATEFPARIIDAVKLVAIFAVEESDADLQIKTRQQLFSEFSSDEKQQEPQANQTRVLTLEDNEPSVFEIMVLNNGDIPRSFFLKAVESGQGATIAYEEEATLKQITGDILGAGFETREIESGGVELIRVTMTGNGQFPGAEKTTIIQLFDDLNGSPIVDAVKAVGVSTVVVNVDNDLPDATLLDGVIDVDLATPGNQVSLRAAIDAANISPGADVIKFNIPGAGVPVIRPQSALPTITDELTIDGSSQPGDRVQLDGQGTLFADALSATAALTVRSLTVANFIGAGIRGANAAFTEGIDLILEDVKVTKTFSAAVSGRNVTLLGNTKINENFGFGVFAINDVTVNSTSEAQFNNNSHVGLAASNLFLGGPASVSGNGKQAASEGQEHGIFVRGNLQADDNLDVKDNAGVGILAPSGSVRIAGAADVNNNGFTGVFAQGDIEFAGTANITGNGHFGVSGSANVTFKDVATVSNNGVSPEEVERLDGIVAGGKLRAEKKLTVNDNAGVGILARGDVEILDSLEVKRNGANGIQSNNKDVVLKNVTITNNGGSGISDPNKLTITGFDNTIKNNAGDGIASSFASEVRLENIDISDNGGDGVRAPTGTVIVAEDNNSSFNDNATAGIRAARVEFERDSTVQIDSNGSNGIVTTGDVILDGSTSITNNGKDATSEIGKHGIVSGGKLQAHTLVVTGNAGTGISAKDAVDVVNSANISSNKGSGIEAANQEVILNNVTISDNDGDGILNPKKLTITGDVNDITNNKENGISLSLDTPTELFLGNVNISNNERSGISTFRGTTVTLTAGARGRFNDNGSFGIIADKVTFELSTSIEVNNNGFNGISSNGDVIIQGESTVSNNGNEATANAFKHGIAAIGKVEAQTLTAKGNAGDGVSAQGTVKITNSANISGNQGSGLATDQDVELRNATIDENREFGIKGPQNLTIAGETNSVRFNGFGGIFSVDETFSAENLELSSNDGDGAFVFGDVIFRGENRINDNQGRGIAAQTVRFEANSSATIDFNTKNGIASKSDVTFLGTANVNNNGGGGTAPFERHGIFIEDGDLQGQTLTASNNVGAGIFVVAGDVRANQAIVEFNRTSGITADNVTIDSGRVCDNEGGEINARLLIDIADEVIVCVDSDGDGVDDPIESEVQDGAEFDNTLAAVRVTDENGQTQDVVIQAPVGQPLQQVKVNAKVDDDLKAKVPEFAKFGPIVQFRVQADENGEAVIKVELEDPQKLEKPAFLKLDKDGDPLRDEAGRILLFAFNEATQTGAKVQVIQGDDANQILAEVFEKDGELRFGDVDEVIDGVITDPLLLVDVAGTEFDEDPTPFDPNEPLVITVTKDEADGNVSAGNLSLREAIDIANTAPGKQTITFDDNAFAGTVIALEKVLRIEDDIEIDGAGNVTLDGQGQTRLVEFLPGVRAELKGLRLTGGQAEDGGAILAFGDSQTSIEDTTFVGNRANDDGGAIFAAGNAEVIVDRTTFIRNTAKGDGGALLAGAGSTLHISGSTFASNTAGGRGGGLFAILSEIVTVTNSTFSANRAAGSGGAIFSAFSRMHIRHSTIFGNVAAGVGGLHIHSGPVTLQHTIVIGNVNRIGNRPSDIGGQVQQRFTAFNLIGDPGSAGGIQNGRHGNKIGEGFRNVLNPVLGNNGGATLTHALTVGSSAIDVGDIGLLVVGTTDQRGRPRILAGRIDIGAIEQA